MPGWLCFVIGFLLGIVVILVYALCATAAEEDRHLSHYPDRKD